MPTWRPALRARLPARRRRRREWRAATRRPRRATPPAIPRQAASIPAGPRQPQAAQTAPTPRSPAAWDRSPARQPASPASSIRVSKASTSPVRRAGRLPAWRRRPIRSTGQTIATTCRRLARTGRAAGPLCTAAAAPVTAAIPVTAAAPYFSPPSPDTSGPSLGSGGTRDFSHPNLPTYQGGIGGTVPGTEANPGPGHSCRASRACRDSPASTRAFGAFRPPSRMPTIPARGASRGGDPASGPPGGMGYGGSGGGSAPGGGSVTGPTSLNYNGGYNGDGGLPAGRIQQSHGEGGSPPSLTPPGPDLASVASSQAAVGLGRQRCRQSQRQDRPGGLVLRPSPGRPGQNPGRQWRPVQCAADHAGGSKPPRTSDLRHAQGALKHGDRRRQFRARRGRDGCDQRPERCRTRSTARHRRRSAPTAPDKRSRPSTTRPARSCRASPALAPTRAPGQTAADDGQCRNHRRADACRRKRRSDRRLAARWR